MPRAAVNTEPSLPETCRQIAVLLSSALSFVAPERGEAMVRKWLGRCDIDEMSEERMLAMTADAMLLSVDLLLSYPATSGTTALDRLARNRSGAWAAEATAIDALCKARFRLLRLEGELTQAGATGLRRHFGRNLAYRWTGPAAADDRDGAVRPGSDAGEWSLLPAGRDHASRCDGVRARPWPRGRWRPGCHDRRALGGGGIWPCSAARDAGRSRLEPAGW